MITKIYDNCVEIRSSRGKDLKNELIISKFKVLMVQDEDLTEYFRMDFNRKKLIAMYPCPVDDDCKIENLDQFTWAWALEDTEDNRNKIIDTLISYAEKDIDRYKKWIKEVNNEIMFLKSCRDI